MELTSLGQFLRKLRIERLELMKNMADKLGVSVSYLSCIETGNREFNKDKFYNEIISAYQLNEEQIKEFDKAISDSVKSVSVNMADKSDLQKEMVWDLARKIEELNDEQVQQIKDILGD